MFQRHDSCSLGKKRVEENRHTVPERSALGDRSVTHIGGCRGRGMVTRGLGQLPGLPAEKSEPGTRVMAEVSGSGESYVAVAISHSSIESEQLRTQSRA
jgi:hypothetical protein